MSFSEFELHPDRLSTTDARGGRIYVHPADVRGFFRRQRTRLQIVLIAFFLGLPWLRIDGRQALLLNISQRHFEIFGLSLRAHNVPLLFFVFAAAAFALFFATTVYGRIWCGWACPQTVFIDGVFRRIERWIEGSAMNRKKLDQAPMSPQKFIRRVVKWLLFSLVTLVLTHSFMAYFIGTENLAKMMASPPGENLGSFMFMAFASGLILFDFGWFREQFCTIVCPYGRFQSVLMDPQSLVVGYDVERGEPRASPQAKALVKAHNGKLGDCVNCYRCVQVCPTGIDIRRGLQMECIACTICIDACDAVMEKIHRPKGLIRYRSMKPAQSITRKFPVRGAIYLALCLGSLTALATSLALMKPVDVEMLRAQDSPYTVQTSEDGHPIVMNHFKIELSNQSGVEHSLLFMIANAFTDPDVQLITAVQPLALADGKVTQADIFIRFPKQLLLNGQRKIHLLIKDKNLQTERILDVDKEVTLVGPFQ